MRKNIFDKTALITGATGFVGTHLVRKLDADGWRVRILTRDKLAWSDPIASRVQVSIADLRDAQTLLSQLDGCRVVYHLAGELRDSNQMQSTNVRGTENLLNACREAQVDQVVFLSSVGVMGARQEGRVDESIPCRPSNEYEKSKYAAEQKALAWSAQTGIPLIALRPTIIFGDGERRSGINSDSVLAWFRAIQKGQFVFFDRRAIANYIYVGDVVSACVLAGQANATGVFVVADSCLLTDFVSTVAQALDCAQPRLLVPTQLALAGAWAAQSLGRLVGRTSPLTIARVRAFSNRTWYDAGKIRAALGWQPEIGWRNGLRRTIYWYRQNGYLS